MTKKSHAIKKLHHRVQLLRCEKSKDQDGEVIEKWCDGPWVWVDLKAFRKFLPNNNDDIFDPKSRIFYQISMRKLDISDARHADLRRLTYKHGVLELLDTWIESDDGCWLDAIAIDIIKEK